MKERLSHWYRANPLTVVAVAAMAGVLLADYCHAKASFWLGAAAVIAFAIGCLRPRLWKLLPAVILGFAFLHALRLMDTYDHPLRERLLEKTGQSARAVIRGNLFPWPDSVEKNETRAGCAMIEMRWEAQGGFEKLPARIKVNLPPRFRLHEPGIYELTGILSLPKAPQNPGQFDGVNYSLRMGWVAELRAHTVRIVEPQSWAPRFRLLRGAAACREWMTEALSLGLDPESTNTGVILAMALGASDAAGDEIEDAFRGSGTLHVFAVSGMQVVLVIMVFGFILRWLGIGKMHEAWILIGLVFVYAYVTGWQPSAARAAFMVAIVLVAPLLNRQAALQNSLGAAALLLLAHDSHQLFMPGFQLSFGVLWAIAIAATPFTNCLRPWTDLDPMLPPTLASRRQRIFCWAKRWVAALVCVSAAAWLGSLPLVLGNFKTITPVALVANCVLVPLSSFCIILSCVSFGFAGIGLTWFQWLINQVNALFAHWMVLSATWFASWPLANVHVNLGGERVAEAVQMRVFQLPGGGAANHLRNGAAHWMIDCGNVRSWRGVLQPYLNQQGVDQLDGMILSHGDASHVGAAPLALQEMHVAQFHTSRLEPWRYDQAASSMRRLSLLAPPDGAVWQRHEVDEAIPMGNTGAMPLSATILYPAARDGHEKADDRALVLMIRSGAIRILWLGDAGFMTEKELLERHVPLRCDILIRNQHSADVAGLAELLLAAQPQAIISSNDATLVEEQMPQRVRDYCAGKGIPLFDLGACGSVGITIEKERASLQAFGDGKSAVVNATFR